jgi:protein phosphatase 1 regulatory subunit 3A/B/C/D/E
MLAVRFHCKGEQFWDSNGGQNYLFNCVPSSTQSSQQGLYHDAPVHHGALYGSLDDPWTTHLW